MATPKDKLNKAHEQKANTSDAKGPWQEALDRHVSVPATRSLEAAEAFRGFAGSWAATYELGFGIATEEEGPAGTPPLQRKTNHIGRFGMPEINFRPYDWGTHRFGPKGPSLLGHPISFEIVGPGHKTFLNDWQWQLTDNAGTANGDVLTIDSDGGNDVSVHTPNGGPAVDTAVQNVVGGPTTFWDYYGVSVLDGGDFPGGLYMVVVSGGYPGTVDNPAGEGGLGSGSIGGRGLNGREGIKARSASSHYEIFRVVDLDDNNKTITLDPAKHVSDYFDLDGDINIVRAITFIRPVATRLQVVPGSDSKVFVVLPPERMLQDDHLPPYYFWTNANGNQWNPWEDPFGGFGGGGLIGPADSLYWNFKPLIPLDIPLGRTDFYYPESFGGALLLQSGHPLLNLPYYTTGYSPTVDDGYEKIINFYDVELVGAARTFDSLAPTFPKDPGIEWLLGPHEVDSVFLGGPVRFARIPEYDPDTGSAFWTPELALRPQWATPDANAGIRVKGTWHEPVKSIWMDPHPSMEKISHGRLTNLINPDWVSSSRQLKQFSDEMDQTPWVYSRPDKAIFDTSSSNAGASGSNANPGNLMDLGFRMVLFPAKDGGAGRLVPDFDNPIDSREVLLDRNKTDEDQWIDIDYSSGLVTLSHTPTTGSDVLRGGIIGAYTLTTAEYGALTFNTDGLGNETITRSLGSWTDDGFTFDQKIVITNANSSGNNVTGVIRQISAATIHLSSATTSGAFGVTLVNDVGDTTAVLTTGDNQRGEVVLFASCVPYSREAGQLGAGIRVAAGRQTAGSGDCAPAGGPSADVFSQRRWWKIQGTTVSPQTITSGENITIILDDLEGASHIPQQGYIEIIAGDDPEGIPAFKDADKYSVSTFGFHFRGNTSGGKFILESCWGGGESGVASITVDDANPYIAVLRRDLMLPSDGRARIGTDYNHDVTYGFANRASAIRFQHARLKKGLDGSVIIEGLEQLAESHEELFDDLFSSWVIDGFVITHAGGNIIDVDPGTVLIDGVRSEMAGTSLDFSSVADGNYYVYIEALGGDPGCPNCTYQKGMPLVEPNDVLVGLVVISGGAVTEVVQLQNKLQDINLRDDILVGRPSSGQNHFGTSHPHFEELADAVAYANELLLYREPAAASTDMLGDRALKIKVIGPTNEDTAKLPITFDAHGIIIEGTTRFEGTHLALTAGIANQGPTIAWDATDTPLFDLNGQSGLIFRDLVLEYRDTGQLAPTGFNRVAFTNGTDSTTSYITIENVHLVGFLETQTGPHYNLPQAFIGIDQGSHRHWNVRNCSALVTEAGIYFGGGGSDTVTEISHCRFENNHFYSGWTTGQFTNSGPYEIFGLAGAYSGVGVEPQPYGGIILCTKSVNETNIVRGNRITQMSGYGIFDNGNQGNVYADNDIDFVGDVGIYTCADWTIYTPSTNDTKVMGNRLKRVHEMGHTSGGAGRQTQHELAVAAGAGMSPMGGKAGIVLWDADNSIVAHNNVNIESGSDRDFSILLFNCDTGHALCNHCDESIYVESGSTESVVADNRIGGKFTLNANTNIVANNKVDGETSIVGQEIIFVGNQLLSDVLGVANWTIFANNWIAGGAETVTPFGQNCVVADNSYSGTGDDARWTFATGCTVVGNWAKDTDFQVSGDGVVIANNIFDNWSAVQVGTDLAHMMLVGNLMQGSVAYNNVAGFLTDSIISDNDFHGGGVFVGNVTATQQHSNNIIANNRCSGDRIEFYGGSGNVILGNVLTGTSAYIHLGNVASTSAFIKGVVADNTIEGFTTLSDQVPDTGAGGTDNYDPSIYGETGSIFNVIANNNCFGGLVGDFSYSTIAGNVFTSTDGPNISVKIGGTAAMFSDNMMIASTPLNLDEDYAVEWTGNLGVMVGNRTPNLFSTGDYCLFASNQFAAGTPATTGVTLSGEGTTLSANHLYNSDLLVASTAIESVISANKIGGNVGVAADDCVFTGNKVGPLKGTLTVTGDRVAITGNHVESSVGSGGSGNVISGNVVDNSIIASTAGDQTITGNWTNAINVAVSSPNTVVSGNRVDGAGADITVGADKCVIVGNMVGGDIVVYDGNVTAGTNDADDYIIANNLVGDRIITAGASNGNGRGVVMGNVVENEINGGDTAPGASQAIPSTLMVVLGNKILSGGAGTYVYDQDPATDSVGAGAANAINDFNVTET